MSSSSDEDLSKFAEAADLKLFNNSLFAEGKGDQSCNVPVKPSQRSLDAPDENHRNLKVTPGFQKHVANRLMKILDSSLDQDNELTERTSTTEHDSNGNCTVDTSSKNPEGGIKLFGASAAFLASCNIKPPPQRKRQKRGRKSACISSESEDDSSGNEADTSNLIFSSEKSRKLVVDEANLSERFAACAVSSDWIYSGEAVKGWAPPLKNKEPIQGEATPDLINITSRAKHKKKKGTRKKEKSSNSEVMDSKNMRKRAKRAKRAGSKKSKKKVLTENDNQTEVQVPLHNSDTLLSKPSKTELTEADIRDIPAITKNASNAETQLAKPPRKKKKRKEQSHLGAEIDDLIHVFDESQNAKAEQIQGTSGSVETLELPKQKKEKRSKSINSADLDISLNSLIKQMKMKVRLLKFNTAKHEEIPDNSSLATLEDEGFDSDPRKADRSRKKERKLLRATLKKQRKSEKKWQNKIEYLSKDLANLMMTNVKQD